MGGARAGFGVTPECVKEVAEALSSMMSTGKVPRRDRALALEALILEVLKPSLLLVPCFVLLHSFVRTLFCVCILFCSCTVFCTCALVCSLVCTCASF